MTAYAVNEVNNKMVHFPTYPTHNDLCGKTTQLLYLSSPAYL